MIKIEYDGEVLNIPNRLDEISLSEFQQISSIKFKNNKRYFIQVLEKFGIPRVAINSLNVDNYIIIKNALTILFNDISQPLQNIIEFNDDKYQFTDNYDDIRMDQFVDMMEMSKDKEEIINNLHIISSLLYRKVIDEKIENGNIIYIVEEYDSSVVLGRSLQFKDMNLEIFLGVLGFFLLLKATYMKDILHSSLQKQKMEMEMK